MHDSAPRTRLTAPSHATRHKSAERLTGRLVRLKDEGYGFIRPDNGDPDYYVAISSMRNRAEWIEGAHVEFMPGKPFAVGPGERSKATPAWDVVAVPTPRRAEKGHSAHAKPKAAAAAL